MYCKFRWKLVSLVLLCFESVVHFQPKTELEATTKIFRYEKQPHECILSAKDLSDIVRKSADFG